MAPGRTVRPSTTGRTRDLGERGLRSGPAEGFQAAWNHPENLPVLPPAAHQPGKDCASIFAFHGGMRVDARDNEQATDVLSRS